MPCRAPVSGVDWCNLRDAERSPARGFEEMKGALRIKAGSG
jgi:hypothetical protein